MSLIDPAAPVIVQGATGRVGKRHTLAMRAYGTRVIRVEGQVIQVIK